MLLHGDHGVVSLGSLGIGQPSSPCGSIIWLFHFLKNIKFHDFSYYTCFFLLSKYDSFNHIMMKDDLIFKTLEIFLNQQRIKIRWKEVCFLKDRNVAIQKRWNGDG